jgi:hypothetical protein
MADQINLRNVQIQDRGAESGPQVLNGRFSIEGARAKEVNLHTFALKSLFEFAKVVCRGKILRFAEKMITVDQNDGRPLLTENDAKGNKKKK